ncbi:MAG: hypothetical protein ABIH39_03975, partial [Candidatus Margulisiibacteriota bacterium]
AVRQAFLNTKLFSTLKSINSQLHDNTKNIYERTIDYGAHPNSDALLTTLKMTKTEKDHLMEINYMTGDSNVIELALKTLSQAGVISLEILRETMLERFKISGMDDLLEQAKQGL